MIVAYCVQLSSFSLSVPVGGRKGEEVWASVALGGCKVCTCVPAEPEPGS
jgi:hypothetical protein